MFMKRKRWFVNIQFQHEKRRKQYKFKDDFKEATGVSVEEEDHAESLKKLQVN